MTARKNKQFCDKCYRNVNKSRLSRCSQIDCGLAHEKSQVNNVVEFKPKHTMKPPQQQQVLQKPVNEPVEDMIEIKCDAPEVGYLNAK